ncbi:MAG: tetratricopeptide (TPR) repeat protein [Cyclobacteriaceae bacterium]|jgi:tetratricopeptide (TPR) repeat protein
MRYTACSFLILGMVAVSCLEVRPSKGERELTNRSARTKVPEFQLLKGDDAVKNDYLSEQDRLRREQELLDAETNYNQDPANEDKIIWYGRRLGYLGKHQEAINVYTEGLVKMPQSYKLYRHRGHRFITIRAFDQAVEDLQNAAFYVSNERNEIEPDGIANAYNKPLSNIKFNIWYHLGLAYYLQGNYDKAISSYKKCLQFSNNNDLKVATINWLFATYSKIGNNDAAEALTDEIPGNMTLMENRLYHDLIMLYRGFVTPSVIIRRNADNGEINATVGYGIGNWYLINGDVNNAKTIFSRVTSGNQVDSFGYIAAEVELNNLNDSNRQ